MTIHCAYSDVLPIAELKQKFHPKNPNQHTPEQIDRLAKIMAYQGVRKAAVISKRSGLITAGHGRILSAEKAGLETYPVDYQDYESDEQEYADLTADNAIAAWSELDLVGINDEALKLESGFDLDLLGIEDFVLDVSETDLPALPDGDKEPFEQITFTLHTLQAEQVRRALDVAKSLGDFDSENENSNGNAIARVCETFLTTHG